MKKLLILLALMLVSCEQRMSTEQLTKEIKQNMIEHFAENSDVAKVELVDLSLIHKGGNEYKGVADVIVENPFSDVFSRDLSEQEKESFNMEYRYTVEVIYDGEMYSWEILTD